MIANMILQISLEYVSPATWLQAQGQSRKTGKGRRYEAVNGIFVVRADLSNWSVVLCICRLDG